MQVIAQFFWKFLSFCSYSAEMPSKNAIFVKSKVVIWKNSEQICIFQIIVVLLHPLCVNVRLRKAMAG